MMLPRFSVIVPARNEERFIGACLESIRVAGRPYRGQVEVIVVLNRCSDKTEEIAHSFGARTIREDARNLARIRNAGACAAVGRVLVTIDADSTVSPGALVAIDRAHQAKTLEMVVIAHPPADERAAGCAASGVARDGIERTS
jgi:glycosyltransferase involved in cell wall biosynthesis